MLQVNSGQLFERPQATYPLPAYRADSVVFRSWQLPVSVWSPGRVLQEAWGGSLPPPRTDVPSHHLAAAAAADQARPAYAQSAPPEPTAGGLALLCQAALASTPTKPNKLLTASFREELGSAGCNYVCLVCMNRWLTLRAAQLHFTAEGNGACAQAGLMFHVRCGVQLAPDASEHEDCPSPGPAERTARIVCLACSHETSNCLQNSHLNHLESGFEQRVQSLLNTWPSEPGALAGVLLTGLQAARGSAPAAVAYWAAVHLVWGKEPWSQLQQTGLSRPMPTSSSLGASGLEQAYVREDNWTLIQQALAMAFGGLTRAALGCAGPEVWQECLAGRSQKMDRYQQEILRLVTHKYLVQVKRARLMRLARGHAAEAGLALGRKPEKVAATLSVPHSSSLVLPCLT